jgi:hypothetical protein
MRNPLSRAKEYKDNPYAVSGVALYKPKVIEVTVILLILLLAASSRAATAKYIVLPSGDRGYSIRCDNDGMNSCYEMAGDICRHGYAIQSKDVQSGFVAEGSSFVYSGGLDGGAVGSGKSSAFSTSDNGLLVLCKDPEAMETARVARLHADQEAREAKERKDNLTLLMILGGMAAVMVVIFGIVAINK